MLNEEKSASGGAEEQNQTPNPSSNPPPQAKPNLSQADVLKALHQSQNNSQKGGGSDSRSLHFLRPLLLGTAFIIILAVVGAALLGQYQSLFNANKEVATPSGSLTTKPFSKSGGLNSTSDWKTYENRQLSYRLKYPPYWFVYPMKDYPYAGYPGAIDKNEVIFTSLSKFPNFAAGGGGGDQYVGINITKTNNNFTGSFTSAQIGDNKAYKKSEKNGDIKWLIPNKAGKGGILISMKSLSVLDIKTIELILSTIKLSQ